MWSQLLQQILSGDIKSVARVISLIENKAEGYEAMLEMLPANDTTKVIGITGPPGAGKSTLTDALIGKFVLEEKKIAVLCIDPSSAFSYGALLGDRIRMSEWYNHSNVFIRSLATRGSLGGLTVSTLEITELLKAAGFHFIIIETVGVGQSEIEIAGIADVTVVVMIPSSGDEVQTMKAGVMEIADIFVVNKSDQPGADIFVKNLVQNMERSFRQGSQQIPIIKTIASQKNGIEELHQKITSQANIISPQKKYHLLAEKAYHLISSKRMKDITPGQLQTAIMNTDLEKFNLYSFIKNY